VSVVNDGRRHAVRTIGLDVHKRFAEVAVHEAGEARRLGRIETTPAGLRSFAGSLGPDDHVVVESTSFSWAVVELLAERAGRVTISNPMKTKAIASAKVKTDKVDAKVLAQRRPTSSRKCGRPTGRRGRCGAGSPTARRWCASAPGCATRSTRS
jgi:hypothetical protein